MATRPMQPVSGNGGQKAGNRALDPTKLGTQGRVMMGASAFHLVDDASATDTKKGFLAARPNDGIGQDTSIFGTTGGRGQGEVTAGPQYGITASRGAAAETYPATLANGRLMRPVMRGPSGSEFVNTASAAGPTGPGQGGRSGGRRSSGSRKPKGSWTPPNKGKTS